MAEKLTMMQNLEVIDFGDCLMKTKGATYIAEALADGHTKLQVSSFFILCGAFLLNFFVYVLCTYFIFVFRLIIILLGTVNSL